GTKPALIVAEVALSFALLAGAGLLVRTFIGVLRVHPGFQATNVLSFSTLGGDYHFLLQLRKNLAGLPGVQSASVVSHLPLDGYIANWYDYYWPEATPPGQRATAQRWLGAKGPQVGASTSGTHAAGALGPAPNIAMADYRSVMPGYFKTISATMIEGRDFTDGDDAAHQHVIIVDDALARQAWPGQDAIGKKLHISDSPAGFYQFQDDWGVVVGVVGHVQYHSLTVMVRPQVYEPYPLAPRPVAFVLRVASSVPLAGMEAPIRAQVAALSKTVAVTRFLPLADLVAQARSQTRFVAFLAVSLAAVALLLTCIGIYGVTAYLARTRRREIAIRMALGAEPSDVRKLVLAHGMAPVIFGCLAGIALALLLSPLLSTLLFGVRPLDAPTFAAAALFLCGVGLTACYVPARRAMRVAPMQALRHE
ncbi:MAG: FtsX-like permease family protein, partial [Terriglobales bacterium]